MITLYDIKNLLKYDCDLADDEYDTWFYADVINTLMAKEIEVVSIRTDVIVCKFSEFMRTHKDYMRNFIKDTYYEPYMSEYLHTLDNEAENCDNWAELIEDAIPLALQYEPLGDE